MVNWQNNWNIIHSFANKLRNVKQQNIKNKNKNRPLHNYKKRIINNNNLRANRAQLLTVKPILIL